MTLEQLIVYHLRASGPVSFDSLFNYCRQQYVGDAVSSFKVNLALADLVDAGEIEVERPSLTDPAYSVKHAVT